jgi:hypothetical protein
LAISYSFAKRFSDKVTVTVGTATSSFQTPSDSVRSL